MSKTPERFLPPDTCTRHTRDLYAPNYHRIVELAKFEGNQAVLGAVERTWL